MFRIGGGFTGLGLEEGLVDRLELVAVKVSGRKYGWLQSIG